MESAFWHFGILDPCASQPSSLSSDI
jgi:hypothetical protein